MAPFRLPIIHHLGNGRHLPVGPFSDDSQRTLPIWSNACLSHYLTGQMSVCLSVWVYSGYIIHHYNGIWGTCAPGRRNMHHQVQYAPWCTRETIFLEKFRGP